MLRSLLLIWLIGNTSFLKGLDHGAPSVTHNTAGRSYNTVLENVDLKCKISNQSSVYTVDGVYYTSDRALDGNFSTCSHTQNQTKSWWTVDLLGLHEITSITINNTDHHNIDLQNAHILIGNTTERILTDKTKCTTINSTTRDGTETFRCENGPKWGRYVTVYKDHAGFLIICEVTISGKKKELPFKLIKENKTWEEALYHCRQEHVDLVSILNKETQSLVELEAKNSNTSFVWLGLHYTCTLDFWFWVDDHCADFDDWATNDTAACDMSAAMSKDEEHQWHKKYANEKFNFICAV